MFNINFTSALVLSTALVAHAAPRSTWHGCNVSNAQLVLPAAPSFGVPAGTEPEYIALGVGTQNYTCTSGTYASAGAVAKLIDISCLYTSNNAMFDTLQDAVYNINQTPPTMQQIGAVLGHYPYVLGDHYFSAQSGTIAPTFDFRAASQNGNPNAYSVSKKIGGIPSPDGTANVDWLELQSTAGQLSKYTFRVDTKAGVSPGACSMEGATITVSYTAKYWFLK